MDALHIEAFLRILAMLSYFGGRFLSLFTMSEAYALFWILNKEFEVEGVEVTIDMNNLLDALTVGGFLRRWF